MGLYTGLLGLWVECSSMVWLTKGSYQRSSHTKGSKMVLDASLLNTQPYKVWMKGKWSRILSYTFRSY